MYRLCIIWLFFFFPIIEINGQNHFHTNESTVHIDSIHIRKNWRTKDKIILKEMGVKPGMDINKNTLDKSITKVWNIGNFSDVRYTIDTLQNGDLLLNVIAKDAFTIVPILSFSGNKEEFQFTAGISDNNFLGKNLHVGFNGSYGSNVTDFSIHVTVPRQLLYKSMAIHSSVVYGHNEQYRYEQGERVSGIGYTKKEIELSVTNPWHRDFQYTFSPDIGIKYFQHTTDSSLIQPEIPFSGAYKINYFVTSFSESIGYIKRLRHQRDGYLISGGFGLGIGLDHNSPHFLSLGGGASYHKLFNPIIQISAKFSTGYTTADIPSLLFYKGNRDVRGIYYGEISGKAYYTAYLGGHFTYINRNWFALEQSFFINWGMGADRYLDIYKTAPLATIGSGVSLMVPMIPWLYIRFYVTWPQHHNNWLSIEF